MKFQKKVAKKINDLYHTYIPPLLQGSKNGVECPCCAWKGKKFLPNGVDVRMNARCPKCDSLERHRLYYLYLKKNIPTDRQLKVLHFAPERILTKLFKSYRNISYLSADIDPQKAMCREDITDISFPENSFDIIFCSHVLEHIEDDQKAMRELARVLKPDGFAVLLVPIKDIFNGRRIETTYEDFTIKDPHEREKAFGQKDHVRVYGRDFKDRLETAGFSVSIDKFVNNLPAEVVSRHSLVPQHPSASETDGWIYVCTKHG